MEQIEKYSFPLAVTYELDESFDSERFIKMRLRVCHDGTNPKGSHFNINDINAAKESLKNIPILANVVFDEDDQPQFGGHDMSIEKDKVNEGEYRMIYKEVPIGVIPEINNYDVQEYNGRNYVFVDGYIWRNYSNYAEDIIKRDKDIKLSMEIAVNQFSYDVMQEVYNITDYKYTGITFLNRDSGTGMKDALATTYSAKKKYSAEDMLIIMQELKDALVLFNKKNTEEGGKNEMDNIDNITLAEQADSAPAEDTVTVESSVIETPVAEADDSEPTEQISDTSADENNDAPARFVKSYELSIDDNRCSLYEAISQTEKAENEWFFIESVSDDSFVYSCDNSQKLFRQHYTRNEDGVSLVGEPIEVHKLVMTKEDIDSLDSMKADYEAATAELNELREYKQNIEKNIENAEKQKVLEKWAEILKGDSSFEALYDTYENYSVKELETECKCIFADSKANFNFSCKNKENSLIRIPIKNEDVTSDESPYGDLFEKYGNK